MEEVYALSKYIVRYRKTGDLKYISHLDLLRTIQRAMRRAELPLKYTEGFNPHPHIVFALPLSVGVEGYNELYETALTEDMSAEEFLDRMKKVMPKGLEVTEVVKADSNKFADISSAIYKVTPENLPDEKIISDFLSKQEILMEKKTKKGIKTVDIRKDIFEIILKDGNVLMRLSAGNTANLKPMAVMDLLRSTYNYDSGYTTFSRFYLVAGNKKL